MVVVSLMKTVLRSYWAVPRSARLESAVNWLKV